MNYSNKTPFKIRLELMNFIALFCVVINVVSERFGTYPTYSSGRFSHMEMIGIIIPLITLIIPVFEKKYRQNFWSLKNIITAIVVLLVSILLIMVMYVNKDYYRIQWIEVGHWTRDECPPIRWDFWNIIGKSA